MKLYHHINGNENGHELVEGILANGLQANFRDWEAVSELLPNRPKGTFFWGEDNKGVATSDRLVVDTSDLDTSKLWAFPAEAAQVADMAICGYELVEEAYEFMAQAQPVAYKDFNGAFAAEWIYTEDISGDALKIG